MYVVTANPTSQIVTVRYYGRVAVADREQALTDLLPVLEETGYRQILVDFRNADCIINDFDASNTFASRLAFQPRLRTCQIAYLTQPGGHVDPVVEALADARGFVFRRFDNRRLAIHWLLESTSHHCLATRPSPLPECANRLAAMT